MEYLSKLRKLYPKDKADQFGVTAAFVLILLVIWNDISVWYAYTRDGIYTETTSILVLVFGLFIAYNVLGNFFKAMSVNTTIDAIEVQIKQLPEWRFCSICEQYAPPRAHHCFICNKCILKRHNHCLFLGKCVGNNNHRYYLVFIFYTWIGAVFTTWLNWHHMSANFDLSVKSLFITFMPMFAWLFGMLSLNAFLWVFVNSICLILTMLMLVYFGMNLRMVVRGQTWHESAKSIDDYNIAWAFNLKQILGRRYVLAVLSPFAHSDLYTDGSTFAKRNDQAANHDSLNSSHSSSSPFNVPKRRII